MKRKRSYVRVLIIKRLTCNTDVISVRRTKQWYQLVLPFLVELEIPTPGKNFDESGNFHILSFDGTTLVCTQNKTLAKIHIDILFRFS